MADWTTISALAGTGGTLVLAGTTYASVSRFGVRRNGGAWLLSAIRHWQLDRPSPR